jgi:leucyl aminopeptidase (aminopeptidase T)
MRSELRCRPARARLLPSLLLITLLVAISGCDRREAATLNSESGAVRSDTAEPGAAPVADFKSVAAKVVNQSAGVREGEIVLVNGSDEDLPLLEDIAIEVMKVGGHPLVSVNTREYNRRSYDEVPAKYDAQSAALSLKLVELANVSIATESGEGRTIKGVPAERVAARGKAFAPVLSLAAKRNVRLVSLGNGLYPSEERAEQFGISREELGRLMYGGVDADYQQLQTTGEQMRKVLAGGKELRITNPSGTDLRVGIAGRQVIVNDGVISPEERKQGGPALSVWLPAGEVYLRPEPGTANGVIVADQLYYQGDRIEGLRLELKGGKMVAMTAKSGLDPLRKYYELASPGKDAFTVVDIGINPGIKLPEGGAVNVWSRAGAVTVVVGSDLWAGGSNSSNFDIAPEIRNATVEVDGTALVKDGKLAGGTAVAGR